MQGLQFAFSNLRFCAILRTFSSIMRELWVQIKNKVHHVNQLIEPDLMMYIDMTFSEKNHSTHSTHSTYSTHSTHSIHSTYLFKIFFSLLTLSTAFLQEASGPGKNHLIIFPTQFKWNNIMQLLCVVHKGPERHVSWSVRYYFTNFGPARAKHLSLSCLSSFTL